MVKPKSLYYYSYCYYHYLLFVKASVNVTHSN